MHKCNTLLIGVSCGGDNFCQLLTEVSVRVRISVIFGLESYWKVRVNKILYYSI